MSLKNSESASGSEKMEEKPLGDGDVTPFYRSVEIPGKLDSFESAHFSFCPPKPK